MESVMCVPFRSPKSTTIIPELCCAVTERNLNVSDMETLRQLPPDPLAQHDAQEAGGDPKPRTGKKMYGEMIRNVIEKGSTDAGFGNRSPVMALTEALRKVDEWRKLTLQRQEEAEIERREDFLAGCSHRVLSGELAHRGHANCCIVQAVFHQDGLQQ